MKDTLIIIGASGHGKVCLDIADKMKHWNNIYFLDNNKNLKNCLGHEVIGQTIDAFKYKSEADFFVAIGDNKTREEIQSQLEEKEYSIATLIHADAIINSFVEIDKGTAIMGGVVINSDTTIGKGCIINTNSSIDHDNKIGNFAHISPGVNLAGTVEIGQRTWVGIGTTVINNIKINQDIIIGAGSLVLRNVNNKGNYYGQPIKMNNK